MGADWLQLFDKKLCDEVLGLNAETLPAFLAKHLPQFREFSTFRYDFDGVPVHDRVKQLLEIGESVADLRVKLVDELCFSEGRIAIDYWGCYVEVFASADPPGAIADYRLFPERQQQSFLLLLPNHVDRILESLDLHRAELAVMTGAEINLLRQWRNVCSADPSQMVAYVFDV
jgi:hypothetical protein